MASAEALSNLQEVAQKLSDKGMMKEEAFRQISEATVSIYNASLQDNPFKDTRLMRDDFSEVDIPPLGEFFRHRPTGRLFVQDPDDEMGMNFKAIILDENHLPITLGKDQELTHDKGVICWGPGQDPRVQEIEEMVKTFMEEDKKTKELVESLLEENKKMKAGLKAAKEGSLLAFQEVEIKDLEEERDRYKKLNEGLIKKLKQQKEESVEKDKRWGQAQNQLSDDLLEVWDEMRENEISIPITSPETEKFFRWWRDGRQENDEELPLCFKPVPFVWNGIDYLLIEPINLILDAEDGEVIGERYMCGSCDEIHVKWFSEDTDSDSE